MEKGKKVKLSVASFLFVLLSVLGMQILVQQDYLPEPPLNELTDFFNETNQKVNKDLSQKDKIEHIEKELYSLKLQEWYISAVRFSGTPSTHSTKLVPLDLKCPYNFLSARGLSELSYCVSDQSYPLYLKFNHAAVGEEITLRLSLNDQILTALKEKVLFMLLSCTVIFGLLIWIALSKKQNINDPMKKFWNSFENILQSDSFTADNINTLPASTSEQRFWKTHLLSYVNSNHQIIQDSTTFMPSPALLNRQSNMEMHNWEPYEQHSFTAYCISFSGPGFRDSFWANNKLSTNEAFIEAKLESRISIVDMNPTGINFYFKDQSITELLDSYDALYKIFSGLDNVYPIIVFDDFEILLRKIDKQSFWSIISKKLDLLDNTLSALKTSLDKNTIIDQETAEALCSLGVLKKSELQTTVLGDFSAVDSDTMVEYFASENKQSINT